MTTAIMCICVTCGHARPFTSAPGSDRCPECQAHALEALQAALDESLWRLEQLKRGFTINVLPDYRDEKQFGM